MIASPTGTGKSTAAAKAVSRVGSTCWLGDRHEDVNAIAEAIENCGGQVGRVLPLKGVTDGVPNCLYPAVIECWQQKGYLNSASSSS